jgi:Tfp pilus assembly protein PilZ
MKCEAGFKACINGWQEMGVRVFDRVPVLIKVTFNSSHSVYTGTLVNLSEKGMFIRTNKIPSLSDPKIEVIIPLDKEKIQVSGRLIRTENIRGYYHGIGVEILNPPQRYLDFLDNLLAVL